MVVAHCTCCILDDISWFTFYNDVRHYLSIYTSREAPHPTAIRKSQASLRAAGFVWPLHVFVRYPSSSNVFQWQAISYVLFDLPRYTSVSLTYINFNSIHLWHIMSLRSFLPHWYRPIYVSVQNTDNVTPCSCRHGMICAHALLLFRSLERV